MTTEKTNERPTYASKAEAIEASGFDSEAISLRRAKGGRWTWELKANATDTGAAIVNHGTLPALDSERVQGSAEPWEATASTMAGLSEGVACALLAGATPAEALAGSGVAGDGTGEPVAALAQAGEGVADQGEGVADQGLPVAQDQTGAGVGFVMLPDDIGKVDGLAVSCVPAGSDDEVIIQVHGVMPRAMAEALATSLARKLVCVPVLRSAYDFRVVAHVTGERPRAGGQGATVRAAGSTGNGGGSIVARDWSVWPEDTIPASNAGIVNLKRRIDDMVKAGDLAGLEAMDFKGSKESDAASTYYRRAGQYLRAWIAKVRVEVEARERALDAEFGAITPATPADAPAA